LSFQSSSNIYHSNVIYPSRLLNQLISTVNSSKKRNIEELEIEVRNDRNN
ncbi:20332_t:CDS:1, partial [Rhizophagus irregularis]